jgi:hypothetical protein
MCKAESFRVKHNIRNIHRVYISMWVSGIAIGAVIESCGGYIKSRSRVCRALHNGSSVRFFIIGNQRPPVSLMACVRQGVQSAPVGGVIGSRSTVRIDCKSRLVEKGVSIRRSRPGNNIPYCEEFALFTDSSRAKCYLDIGKQDRQKQDCGSGFGHQGNALVLCTRSLPYTCGKYVKPNKTQSHNLHQALIRSIPIFAKDAGA